MILDKTHINENCQLDCIHHTVEFTEIVDQLKNGEHYAPNEIFS